MQEENDSGTGRHLWVEVPVLHAQVGGGGRGAWGLFCLPGCDIMTPPAIGKSSL